MTKSFKLPFYCSNGGDGSVSVRFCQSLEEAETKDSEMEEGWGESSARSVKIKVEDNKLFYEKFESVDGKYQYVWKEVEEA